MIAPSRFGLAALGLLCILSFPARAAEDTDKIKYVGTTAGGIIKNFKDGNGWCIVSAREKRTVIEGERAVDCVQYRVAAKYTVSQLPGLNGQMDDVIEVTFGKPTDWIAVELNMPTASGPSLTAAKAANEAVGQIDIVIALLEAGITSEPDAKVKADGAKVLAVLKAQRAALADLISKDVAAIGDVMK